MKISSNVFRVMSSGWRGEDYRNAWGRKTKRIGLHAGRAPSRNSEG